MSVDNEAQATTALNRIKRELSDPFEYMAKARKPSKIAKAQQKRQNVPNNQGDIKPCR